MSNTGPRSRLLVDAAYLKDALHFTDYQIRRTLLMNDMAEEISGNHKSKLVLKGGTALLLCYGLPRFSTDLDYDGQNHGADIVKNIEAASRKNMIKPTAIITKKNTETVKRYMLHYQEEPDNPLKIEISFRNIDFLNENQNSIVNQNGINVYDINTLSKLKTDAFLDRYAARDIYDMAFLLKTYPDSLKKEQICLLHKKCKTLGVDYLEKRLNEDGLFKSHDCAAVALSIEEMLSKELARHQPYSRHKPQRNNSCHER
jgi:predicted nucleotidyltransferase component of viral defense system